MGMSTARSEISVKEFLTINELHILRTFSGLEEGAVGETLVTGLTTVGAVGGT